MCIGAFACGNKKFNVYSFLLLLLIECRLWSNYIHALDVKCGPPAIPINAELVLSEKEFTAGVSARYKCKEGFEIFGNTEIICDSHGKWKGELPFCGTNVAFRKPANQSSTVRGGKAQNANSGTKLSELENSKCSETQKEPSPYWQVDLLKPYPIKVIRITTRGCCGHQPLHDIEIRVGNSSVQLQRNPLCAWFPETLDEGITKAFTCARTIVGRYVFIQLVGVDGSLSLCQVEVFTSDELSVEDCSPKGAPEDLQITSFNRTCIEFVSNQGKTFKEARNYCQKYRGDLIHHMPISMTQFIHSELERRKSKLKTQLVWIGVQKEPGEYNKKWRWINGEPIYVPQWGSDQPNNYNGEQNCVVLDGGRSWLWNDVGCNLDYLHWICEYTPTTCGSPDRNENTTTIGNNFEVGATVLYLCPEGYMLVGDHNRSCDSRGLWTGKSPTCKYVNCNSLNEIENGSVELIDKRTTYGARANYKCNDNYTLVGVNTRECQEEGRWSDTTPKCLFTWCDTPSNIDGGVVTITGNKAGDTASYQCNDGYLLIGKSVLKCEFGGKWSGKIPSCQYVDCGPPAVVLNGKANLINQTTYLGSMIEYACKEDYWLDGEKIQTCTKEGKWSGDTPSCELITCPEPEVPPGSYVVGYDFNVNSAVEYNCEPGYILRGQATLVCLRNGEWSEATPYCEYIDCGRVIPPMHGEVIYTNKSTYLDSEIIYKCSKTYRLTGDSKRYCLENKQWNGIMPMCEEIRCPEPVLAKHSILSVTGNDRLSGRTLIKTNDFNNAASTFKVGSLVKYRCERGYKIVGNSISTCEENGFWSGEIPTCTYVDCKQPEKVKNGEVVLTSNATFYGAIALYSCNTNYELEGISRRICLENGTWSVEPPKCKEIRCKNPDAFDGAMFVVANYVPGSMVTYSCPRGHNLKGNNTRQCMLDGKWSGKPPRCIPVQCDAPNKMENGHVIVTNGTIYNSAIEYHCTPGFKRSGPYLRKCLEDGNWSGEEPKCEVFIEQPQESSNLGQTLGIGAGMVVVLLAILGLIYSRLKKPVPVKNTDNVASAERKDDRSASVVSYASLGGNGYSLNAMMYGNTDDNIYNSPYEDTRGSLGGYEPEPITSSITINNVAVR